MDGSFLAAISPRAFGAALCAQDIAAILAGPLASVLDDPEVPACMRDAGAVAAAAAACAELNRPDPDRAGEGLAAASALHPELRVPGALWAMNARAEPLVAAAGPYVPAPVGMAWPEDFLVPGRDGGPRWLPELLRRFARHAAARLRYPRIYGHRASLDAAGRWRRLAVPADVHDGFGEDDVDRFAEAAVPALAEAGSTYPIRYADAAAGLIREQAPSILKCLFGADCAAWMVKRAQPGFAAGFARYAIKEGALLEHADPKKIPEEFLYHVLACACKDTVWANPVWSQTERSTIGRAALIELGPERSALMAEARRVAGLA
ncbi:MAG: hypothetical protein HY928_06735 [Elusimicrobia bacterium]|nr:hypothetical protein [Elusimicrobiota bacterium]